MIARWVRDVALPITYLTLAVLIITVAGYYAGGGR